MTTGRGVSKKTIKKSGGTGLHKSAFTRLQKKRLKQNQGGDMVQQPPPMYNTTTKGKKKQCLKRFYYKNCNKNEKKQQTPYKIRANMYKTGARGEKEQEKRRITILI